MHYAGIQQCYGITGYQKQVLSTSLPFSPPHLPFSPLGPGQIFLFHVITILPVHRIPTALFVVPKPLPMIATRCVRLLNRNPIHLPFRRALPLRLLRPGPGPGLRPCQQPPRQDAVENPDQKRVQRGQARAYYGDVGFEGGPDGCGAVCFCTLVRALPSIGLGERYRRKETGEGVRVRSRLRTMTVRL